MSVSVRHSGGVTILDIKGKFIIGLEYELTSSLRQVLDSGAMKIVINMSGVSRVDSAGIGELVTARTTAFDRGARVKLAELPPSVTDIITITQLITVLDVYDTEDEAVRSFA